MQPLTLVCLLRFRVQVEEDAALIMNSIQRCITLVRERSHPVVINTDDLQTSFCALPHSYLVMRPRHVTRASPACPRIILHPGTMERRQLPHLTSSLAPVITPLARLLLGLRPAVKRSRPVQVHHPTPLADSPRAPPPPPATYVLRIVIRTELPQSERADKRKSVDSGPSWLWSNAEPEFIMATGRLFTILAIRVRAKSIRLFSHQTSRSP